MIADWMVLLPKNVKRRLAATMGEHDYPISG